ncbi:hypothetical protein THASP1DRAFT_27353 [Thamnocephalis sphaerospora]|uniref:Calcium-dependent phosphotriesterase n=1 Tax=Thamnocephalis sphaerospora TaxID=78915 RepID=A0A4P9XWX6_9FUNG|nr:hypothetical protein THASP1DRAFT_27353 [Thamnocephalis sphaerospora]|eukprot:RKP10868.1 hypothetical protein THASP1DRAFT_27353 [Thamnocephalis sphaerospora]
MPAATSQPRQTQSMPSMRYLVGAVGALAFAWLIVPYAYTYYYMAGHAHSLEPLNNETCRYLTDAEGCEDIVIDHTSGLAYMACANVSNRFVWWPPSNTFVGNATTNEQDPIFVYSLKHDTLERLPMKGLKGNFRTHGLGLWRPSPDAIPPQATSESNENPVLMFINHGRDGSSVEIFEHVTSEETGSVGELRHLETVRDPLITTPNNVAPLSRRSFYVSNDHMFPRGPMRVIEELSTIPLSNVAFRDEQGNMHIAASNVPYANGLATYANDTLLMVVSGNTGYVLIYERDDSRLQNGQGELRFRGRIWVGFAGDNINVDHTTGHIYVGGSLEVIQLRQALHYVTVTAASQVLRVSNVDLENAKGRSTLHADITPLLVFNGRQGTGLTVGAVDGSVNRTLVGGPYALGFYVCDIA